MILATITNIRLQSDAMEKVTGELMDSSSNASAACRKCVIQLKDKRCRVEGDGDRGKVDSTSNIQIGSIKKKPSREVM